MDGGAMADRANAQRNPFGIAVDPQLDASFLRTLIAKADHFPKLPAGVDVEQRDRWTGWIEGLQQQVQQDRTVLADRVHHHRISKPGRDLAQDVDALGLETIQVRQVSNGFLERHVQWALRHGRTAQSNCYARLNHEKSLPRRGILHYGAYRRRTYQCADDFQMIGIDDIARHAPPGQRGSPDAGRSLVRNVISPAGTHQQAHQASRPDMSADIPSHRCADQLLSCGHRRGHRPTQNQGVMVQAVLATPAMDCTVPASAESQMAFPPVAALRQSRSDFLSPLKSPTSATVQFLSPIVATVCALA